MNKVERLKATIQGEPVDRVAVALWRHWPGDDQRPDDLAAAHIAYQKEFDWDFIKVTPASSYSIIDWGIKDRWDGSIEGTRRYIERVIDKPEDWLSLRVLDPLEGGLGRHLKTLEILRDAFKEDVPFLATIFSPLAQAKYLAGQDNLVLHMRQNAGQVHHALQTITDSTVRFIQEAKQRGIAGIFYAVQHANYLAMSEAEYEVFGRPYDLQILSVAKNGLWLNTLHVHGSHAMFDMVADYPVQLLNWHDRTSAPNLQMGLKRIKGAACGGVDRDALHADTPEPALQQAKDAFQKTQGRRWVLGVGCVALATTPIGNIRKLRSLADTMQPPTLTS